MQRDLMAGGSGAAPREHMTAAANPSTSRSLAMALSAELLDDESAGRAGRSYKRRKPEPAHTTEHEPAQRQAPDRAPERAQRPVRTATATASAGRACAERPTRHEAPSRRIETAPAVIMLPPPSPKPEAEADAGESVIVLPGPVEPSRALVPVETKPLPPRREPDGRKADLTRQLRRTWMSAAFKTKPHCLFVARLRPAMGELSGGAEALARHPSMLGITNALSELGAIYDLGAGTVALIVPGVTLHQTLRIGEAVGAAVDQRTSDGEGEPVLFSAGIAAMYRDDDPVTVMLVADRCLELACERDDSAVVGENDPAIRRARLR